MKMNKILCVICCLAIAVTTTAFAADTEVNYSSVVPKSLVLETWSGAPQSEWIMVKGDGTQVEVGGSNDSKFGDNGITKKVASAAWNPTTSGLIKVGKFKNSMQVAYFTQHDADNDTYSTRSWEGALGFQLTNEFAKTNGGSVAVVSKKMTKYGTNFVNQWGGYSDDVDSSTGRLNGYDDCVSQANMVKSVWDVPRFTNDNSYYVAGVYVEKNVDLSSTYFTLYTGKEQSNAKQRYAFGVPMKDYITSDMVGKYVEIAIPVMDFINSEHKVVKYASTDSSLTEVEAPTDFNALIGMGLMKTVGTAEDAADNNYVYLLKQQIVKIATPYYVGATKTEDSYNGYYETLTINHNQTAVMDNDITAFEITLKDKDGKVLFTKVVSVEELEKTRSGNDYKYKIGTRSPEGATYYVSAIAGELVGNEDIGYTPVKSPAKTSATSLTTSAVAPSLSYKKASGDLWVAVDNAMLYDCKIIIARYSSDGTELKQADIFNPVGEKCFVKYESQIKNDIIKVFAWTSDSDIVPLTEAATQAQ